MDKDLLRIVIIVVGIILILGMILWGRLRGGSSRDEINFYDDKNPLENIDPKLVVNTEDDDFDIVPLSTRENDAYQVTTRSNPEYKQKASADDDEFGLDLNLESDLALDLDLKLDQENLVDEIPETVGLKKQLPALIQLSIVAQAGGDFTGTQIKGACEKVGLVYGTVKVFERLDILGRVDYAVASMVEPGIFPDDNWKTYRSPGITFFIQPKEVDDAAAVFDEMINTIGQLSSLLKGDVLDQDRQLLTQTVLHDIEASLV